MTKIIAIDPQTNTRLGELNNRGHRTFFFDEHIHQLVGEHSFTFSMDSHIKEAEFFSKRGRFLIPSERNGFHEFIIHKTQTIDDEKTVIGTAAYTEMDTAYIVGPGTYTGTLEELASEVLQYTKYRLGVFQDIRIRSVVVEEHMGAYAFLRLLAKTFEVEIDVRIELSGTRFTGRYVDFLVRIGEEGVKEVVYGRDLISTNVIEHTGRIATRLIGIGPTRKDGTYLTSIVENEEAFQRWNDQNQHVTRVYVPESNDEEMTQERLDQLTETELNKRIAAVMEYEITAASIEQTFKGEKVTLGYSLFIKNPQFSPPLYASARVIGIKRSIVNPDLKTYTIGEVETFSEEDAKRTFRALQRLYGVKLIESDIPPPGQPKTVWIDTSFKADTVLNVPHTFDFQTNTWKKFAPSSAAEIGGVVVGKQYNGVTMSPEFGLTIDRTDGLVKTEFNATRGIYIQSRPTDTGEFRDVFFVDEFGNLTFAGIIRGSEIILGGEDNKEGILQVLSATGELSSELRAGYFGTEEARVGYLDAPNKLEYADFRGMMLTFWVASEAIDGVQPSDENTGTERWDAPLRTIQEAVNRIPKSFDGSVRIVLAYNHDFHEELMVAGFIGNGSITIDNDGGQNTVFGKITVQHNSTSVYLDRLKINATDTYAAVDYSFGAGAVRDCEINGVSGGTQIAVRVGALGHVDVDNTVVNNIDYGISAAQGGSAHATNMSGTAKKFAFRAIGTGRISGAGTAPTGELADYDEYQGGTVKGSWTFPIPPTPPAPTPVEATKTYSANSGSGTWRADFGGLWDSGSNYGNAVTQGSWSGYGPFTGAFIFGTAPSSDVTGKTIKRIRLQITRLSGGTYAAQNVVIRPHGSTSRPSGNVSLQSVNYAAGIKVGETRWITLPSSFHAGFQNGSYKGLGINGGSYVKLSKTARLEITYE
ncbi:phage tail spike protein [Planomicrobium sp. MB-3u-38]|uniref:phage tail spike protein n=1 Tax=Planomicrobium sp. MB-3u-38 TaxID=2058318 RepID=UPI000C7C432A|nr:phage tail spike protein [Planomicrobium sp. MB-3u-38]PKH09867.1 hypothetical protein CXF70_11690 [Planomicrobium sp. MB-3u-38]